MEPKGSLPCSQKPATRLYPEPAESSSPPSIPISLRSILMLSFHLRLGIESTKSHALFSLLRSCQRISPSPRRFETFRNNKNFLRLGVVSPTPNLQAGGPTLSAVRNCLFNIFTATLHIWRTSLHPQPEDAPYRGDKGPT
jgi:hypothetical protein